ncbi:hypothetical protein QUF80_02105 [Desulfococcaceae bacterium HSG8]|nr:hypothetical protein [Desulfococcaceae bacterium HSG8]
MNIQKRFFTLVQSGVKIIEIVSYEWLRIHAAVNEISEKTKRPWFMFQAFSDEREFTTEDISKAIEIIVPLVATMPETIADLRKWAKVRARLASEEAEDEKKLNTLARMFPVSGRKSAIRSWQKEQDHEFSEFYFTGYRCKKISACFAAGRTL